MTIRPIISYPQFEHILKDMAIAVQMVDPDLPQIVQDLKDTLLATANGVGLAAPQIGILKRIFVLRKDYIKDDLAEDSELLQAQAEVLVFINPKIVTRKGIVHEEEGCLSIPGTCVKIERAKVIKVRARDAHGEQFYEKFKGLAARAVQQEIDHLNGILIIDHHGGVKEC
ncbi:MAG: peptide deformylase [PVC group bacterium]|nr:peptide deformylase [PVC group bacterium]